MQSSYSFRQGAKKVSSQRQVQNRVVSPSPKWSIAQECLISDRPAGACTSRWPCSSSTSRTAAALSFVGCYHLFRVCYNSVIMPKTPRRHRIAAGQRKAGSKDPKVNERRLELEMVRKSRFPAPLGGDSAYVALGSWGDRAELTYRDLGRLQPQLKR